MDTRPRRMLSGAEIVDRGRNVTDCILPEVGIKEVTPNGSWLETKQIQTALEARKALVAVERIDKVGALSHAEWRDELRLAEVTQQVGGHWQYLGHNVNGTLFLLPEEALFLIETNCLLLKHNSITVSLQKAYSILLDDSMTLTQYKVYSSLSRVGYKVFRHGRLKPYDLKSKEITKIDRNGDENMKVFERITKHKAIKSDQHNANISSENLAISKNPPPDGSIVIIQSEISDMLLQLNGNNSIMENEMLVNPTLPLNNTTLDKEPEMPENPTLPINKTTLNKEPEMPENSTLPTNNSTLTKEPEMPENSTLPTNNSTLTKEPEMPENPTLPINKTTLNKEPEMPENSTIPINKTTLNKEPEMPENPTLPINKTTLNKEPEMPENSTLPTNNSTLTKEPEMPENPTLPINKTTLNKEPEMPENSTLPTNNSTLTKEPEMPENPTLPINKTTLNKEPEMPENSTLPTNNSTLTKKPEMPENSTIPINNTCLNKEPEMPENPTLPSNKTALNKEPEIPENITLPSNKTDLNKEAEIPENPTLPSNKTALNKETEMPENPTLPSNKTALNREPEMPVNTTPPTNNTTLYKEPEMPESTTPPTNNSCLNKEPEMPENTTPPTNNTTLNKEPEMPENTTPPTKNTTLNKEPEMPENTTLRTNNSCLNKDPEMPENTTPPTKNTTLNKEPEMPENTTPPTKNTTLNKEPEMPENTTLRTNNSCLNKDPEMPENTTPPTNNSCLNKEPEMPENITLPSNNTTINKEPEMLVKPTLPTDDATLNIDDTTVNMEIEMFENPTILTNSTTLNKKPEMPTNYKTLKIEPEMFENPTLPTNDKTLKIEPEMSVKPTLRTDDTTLNMEIEMSENPFLLTKNTTINKDPEIPENPTLLTNDKTLKIEPEMSVEATLPTDDTTLEMEMEKSENLTLPTYNTTLNKEPEMPENPTLPTDDTTLDMEIEMSENPTSDNTLNKESTVSTGPNSNEKISSNNEDFPFSNTGLVLSAKGVAGELSIDKHGVIRLITEEVPADIEMEVVISTASDSHTAKTDEIKSKNTDQNKTNKKPNIYRVMLDKIKKRKIQYSDPKTSQKIFNSIPDCFNTQTITVNVPKDDYLPRNVFLNKTSYVLNLKNIRSKRRKSTPPTVENSAMSRTSSNSREMVPTPELSHIVPNMPLYQRPFGYFPNWRPRFQPFNQRPTFPRHNFIRHPQFYGMMHFIPQTFNANRPFMGPNFQNIHNEPNQRKRRRNQRYCHLQDIKGFSRRLKDFPVPPNNSINALLALVSKYNKIYNENIMIGPDFEIINAPQANVETIELDKDEGVTKKPLLDSAKFDKYFVQVKAMAAKLMSLERKNKPTAKQKRVFKNLLKNFNKTFNTEFYFNSKGKIIDKKLVVLDSSSDSDVIATDDKETKKKKRSPDGDSTEATRNKKRKVINPFNVLKTVNEGAGTSQSAVENITPDIPLQTVSGDLSKYFDKNWLPNDGSFGEPNLCPKTDARYLWTDSQELYDLISWADHNTWTDLKLSFCSQMEAGLDFEQDLNTHAVDTGESSKLKPILSQESSDELLTSLEKLRIINIDTEVQDTNLRIDLDVYNRDVQNFRKTDPPKPHFRVVCVEESSKFPSGAEVRAIHTRNEDNVTLVFAVVGVGSITYLQMNPKDLPVLGND